MSEDEKLETAAPPPESDSGADAPPAAPIRGKRVGSSNPLAAAAANKASKADKVKGGLSSLAAKIKKDKADAPPPPPTTKQAIGAPTHPSPRAARKKRTGKSIWVMPLIVVTVLGLLAAFIVPLIPAQMQRSAGFAALQSQDYASAFEELQSYTQKRKNDYQAMYNLAIAAFETGQTEIAKQNFTQLYESRRLADEPALPYYYALLNWDAPDVALPALNQLLANNPSHVAGRMLRGILMQNTPDGLQQARGDFLQADEVIRSSDSDFPEIYSLHRFAQENNLINLQARGYVDSYFLPIPSVLSFELGSDIGLNGYVNQYQLSRAPAIANESLSPRVIIVLYLAYILMQAGELEQAENELNEVLASNPDALSGKQALAFLAAFQNDNDTAKTLFEELVATNPDDLNMRKNLANAMFLSQLDTADLAPVIEQYEAVLGQLPSDETALTNLGFLHMMLGNFSAANDVLNNPEEKDVSHTPAFLLNRGLAQLQQNQYDEAIATFGSIDRKQIPVVVKYTIDSHIARGNLAAADKLLEESIKDYPNDIDLLTKQILLHDQQGEQRLAYFRAEELFYRRPPTPRLLYQLALYAHAFEGATSPRYARYANLLALMAGEESGYALALRASAAAAANDLAEAAQLYDRASQNAVSVIEKNKYLVQWALLLIENSPAMISPPSKNLDVEEAERLRLIESSPAGLIAKRLSEEPLLGGQAQDLQAILAFAITDTRPTRATRLAEEIFRNEDTASFVAKKYAGMTLLKIGDTRKARLLLAAARNIMPADLTTLEWIQYSYPSQITASREGREGYKIYQEYGVIIDYINTVKTEGASHFAPPPFRAALPLEKDIIAILEDLHTNPQNSAARQVLLDSYNTALATAEGVRRAKLLYSRGSYYVVNGDLEKAIEDLEPLTKTRILKREDLVGVFFFYQKALVGLERFPEAFSVINLLIRSTQGTPTFHRFLTEAMIAAKQYESAEQELIELIPQYPLETGFYLNYARLYLEQGKFDQARAQAVRALAIDNKFLPAYELLSEIYRLQGKIIVSKIYNHIQNII